MHRLGIVDATPSRDASPATAASIAIRWSPRLSIAPPRAWSARRERGTRPASHGCGHRASGARRRRRRGIRLLRAQLRRTPQDAVAACVGRSEREERQLVDRRRDAVSADVRPDERRVPYVEVSHGFRRRRGGGCRPLPGHPYARAGRGGRCGADSGRRRRAARHEGRGDDERRGRKVARTSSSPSESRSAGQTLTLPGRLTTRAPPARAAARCDRALHGLDDGRLAAVGEHPGEQHGRLHLRRRDRRS